MSENKNPIDDESIDKSDSPQRTEEPNTKQPEINSPEKGEKMESVTREQFEAVAKNLSGKDKEISEMRKQLKLIQERETIKDKLFELEAPTTIKTRLKAKLDSGSLTLDSFDTELGILTDVYNDALQSAKEKQVSNINNAPQKTEIKDVDIKDVKDMKELEEMFTKMR